MSNLYSVFRTCVNWAHQEFRDSVDNFMRDFKSMRSMWCIIFLLLYLWQSVWLTLYHAGKWGGALIAATASLAAAIFTNYVWGSHMDKRHGVVNIHKKAKKPEGEEDGQSD